MSDLNLKNNISTLHQFQHAASQTAQYPSGLMGLAYTALGMAGEAGEFANKLKKVIRDDEGKLAHAKTLELADELGDILWYVSENARQLGVSLEEIANMNARKLASRKQRGTITGSGDKR